MYRHYVFHGIIMWPTLQNIKFSCEQRLSELLIYLLTLVISFISQNQSGQFWEKWRLLAKAVES